MLKEKIKKIPILKKIIKIHNERLFNNSIQVRKKELNENGMQILHDVFKAFSNYNYKVFADYGTLLGLIREGKVLAWDNDIDLGVLFDGDYTWIEIERVMNQLGYKLQYYFVYKGIVTEQNYSNGKMSIDLFRHDNIDDNSISYVYYKDKKEKYQNDNIWSVMEFKTDSIFDIQNYHLEECDICIPVNHEDYLSSVYTSNWRTPNPDWHTGDGPATTRLKGEYAEMFIC